MRLYFSLPLVLIICAFILINPALGQPATQCTPTYSALDKPLTVKIGAWDLTFRLLAIGCKEQLIQAWPPNIDKVQKLLAQELQEPHPVAILFQIRNRSPELRARVTATLNKALGKKVVTDVFLYSASAAEGL